MRHFFQHVLFLLRRKTLRQDLVCNRRPSSEEQAHKPGYRIGHFRCLHHLLQVHENWPDKVRALHIKFGAGGGVVFREVMVHNLVFVLKHIILVIT